MSGVIVVTLIILIVCFLINKVVFKGNKKLKLFSFSIIFIVFSIGNFTYAMIENSKELADYEYILSISKSSTSNKPVMPHKADKKKNMVNLLR